MMKRKHGHRINHNWEIHHDDLGNAFGHLALGVQGIYKICDELRSKGAKIICDPWSHETRRTELAFIGDPSGYKIELIDLNRRGQV